MQFKPFGSLLRNMLWMVSLIVGGHQSIAILQYTYYMPDKSMEYRKIKNIMSVYSEYAFHEYMFKMSYNSNTTGVTN